MLHKTRVTLQDDWKYDYTTEERTFLTAGPVKTYSRLWDRDDLVYSLMFEAGDELTIGRRRVYTLLDMLGDIGGLADAVWFILMLIVFNWANTNLILQLVFKIFRVNER